jgi:decaprenylphospho-beta-D-ribofuranose 2-oxidase
MTVVDGTGQVHNLTPDDSDPNAFWATVGGMGLTGVITEATFDLIPISSSLISVDTERANDLDEVMARMVERDADYRYSVAWIDSMHRSGRGVLTRGDHAPADALPAKKRSNALSYDPKVLATAPKFIPGRLLNNMTVRAFNEAWFRKHPKSDTGALHTIASFFHPLDGVQEWNRVYGREGFLQYQCVVPDEAADVVPAILGKLRDIGAPSFLTVLKRFGAANPAPLSFPKPGWTLAADVPARVQGLARVLDELDERVAASGGRLYLAKDSRQSPEMFARTYPEVGRWRETRRDMDPNGVFTSDLERRLFL